ncbi:LysM peptidoglycan-binding domain-containing protein, partial [Nocardiopsis gilva]
IPEWAPSRAPRPEGSSASTAPAPGASPAARVAPSVPSRRTAPSDPAGPAARALGPEPTPAPAVRLTRRGRVVLVSAASAAVVAGLSMLFVTSAAVGASASGTSPEASVSDGARSTVVVRDGDTLWGIAQRVRPGYDPRPAVHEIVELNDLPNPDLTPGQELLLPDY